jgi:REP element-mobilizing transposase RayT
VIQCPNGTQLLSPEKNLEDYQKRSMKNPSVFLDSRQRKIVLETIIEHCKVKNWKLWAVHVRSSHVHMIISANIAVEKIMTDIKAWATRKLRENGFNMSRVWTKHGSTRYLGTHEILQQKIRYVICEQGKMMEYYVDENFL